MSPEIWQVPYAPGFGAEAYPVEVLAFARLRAMTGPWRRVQRPAFHVLALVEAGEGVCRADFVEQPLRPGTVLSIRPGAVHQWVDVEAVEGRLILFTADAVDTTLLPAGSGSWMVTGAGRQLAFLAAEHLAAEHGAAAHEARLGDAGILKALLTALLLRVAQLAPAAPRAAPNDVFRRYRDAVEAGFSSQHQVVWYARQLGYGPRTLSRATSAAAGVPAKRFLDERIVLEAKRLLAHTELSVAGCARRLGFDDPAGFTVFFQRQTGRTPGAWRSDAIRDGRTRPPTPR